MRNLKHTSLLNKRQIKSLKELRVKLYLKIASRMKVAHLDLSKKVPALTKIGKSSMQALTVQKRWNSRLL